MALTSKQFQMGRKHHRFGVLVGLVILVTMFRPSFPASLPPEGDGTSGDGAAGDKNIDQYIRDLSVDDTSVVLPFVRIEGFIKNYSEDAKAYLDYFPSVNFKGMDDHVRSSIYLNVLYMFLQNGKQYEDKFIPPHVTYDKNGMTIKSQMGKTNMIELLKILKPPTTSQETTERVQKLLLSVSKFVPQWPPAGLPTDNDQSVLVQVVLRAFLRAFAKFGSTPWDDKIVDDSTQYKNYTDNRNKAVKDALDELLLSWIKSKADEIAKINEVLRKIHITDVLDKNKPTILKDLQLARHVIPGGSNCVDFDSETTMKDMSDSLAYLGNNDRIEEFLASRNATLTKIAREVGSNKFDQYIQNQIGIYERSKSSTFVEQSALADQIKSLKTEYEKAIEDHSKKTDVHGLGGDDGNTNDTEKENDSKNDDYLIKGALVGAYILIFILFACFFLSGKSNNDYYY